MDDALRRGLRSTHGDGQILTYPLMVDPDLREILRCSMASGSCVAFGSLSGSPQVVKLLLQQLPDAIKMNKKEGIGLGHLVVTRLVIHLGPLVDISRWRSTSVAADGR